MRPYPVFPWFCSLIDFSYWLNVLGNFNWACLIILERPNSFLVIYLTPITRNWGKWKMIAASPLSVGVVALADFPSRGCDCHKIVMLCVCPAPTNTHPKSVIIKCALQLLNDFPVTQERALVWIKGCIQICQVYGGFPQQYQIPVCEWENPSLFHIYKPHCHYHWCSISYDNYHCAFSFNRADICLIHVESCQVGLWYTCWN